MVAAVSWLAFFQGDDDANGGVNGDDDAQEQLLASMVLTEDDMTGGLIEVSRSFSTNEESAAEAREPEETLARFEAWGRQLGLSVSFLVDAQASGPQTYLGVLSEANLHDDAQGGALAYRYYVALSEDADWAASFPELSEIEVTEIDAANVGEEAYWLRVSGVTADGADLQVVDQVVFRLGRVRAFLRADSQFLAAASRNSGEGQVLFWAQVMSQRIAAGLVD